jgi:hypothetical protein
VDETSELYIEVEQRIRERNERKQIGYERTVVLLFFVGCYCRALSHFHLVLQS